MLARMDTHPEEFRPRGHRWKEALTSMLLAASPEERLALETKRDRFSMDALHEQIMSELLEGKSENTKSPLTLETERRAQAVYEQYQTAARVSPPAGVGSALKAIFK
jgi:hypothetical protein